MAYGLSNCQRPMTLRDPECAVRHAVRSAILATAWLLVLCPFCRQNLSEYFWQRKPGVYSSMLGSNRPSQSECSLHHCGNRSVLEAVIVKRFILQSRFRHFLRG